MRESQYCCISLIVLSAMIVATVSVAFSYTTKLNVSPTNKTVLTSQSFTVNVTVTNVVGLNNWQVYLSFNPLILNCTGLSIPSDGIFAGHAYFFPPPDIDNTAGLIRAFCSLEGEGATVSGSGKLVTISFRSRTFGVSALTFLNVMKKQSDGTYLLEPDFTMIPFDATGGIVEVVGSGFHKDVFNVVINSQTYYVGVRTNSTVTDFYYSGTSRELRFNVTGTTGTKGAVIVEIDKHVLNGSLITLLSNVALTTSSPTLGTLPQNGTYCFPYFNFTYNASTKNIKIRLTVTGDLNGDRRVDVIDLAIESRAYGTVPGMSKWNPVADVDRNLKVDVKDLAIVSRSFGSWLPP